MPSSSDLPVPLPIPEDSVELVHSPLFRSKEASWLAFNARVLQEGADPANPPVTRLRFLGIHSSNMDEFFRVRVATLKRLVRLGKHYKKLKVPDPKKTLKEVNALILEQNATSSKAYEQVFKDLAQENIHIITHTEIPEEFIGFVDDYFTRKVKPHIMPIMVKGTSLLTGLRDNPMYLAVRLSKSGKRSHPAHALLEIPTNLLPRFTVFPETDGVRRVMFLDDIIRHGLPDIFFGLPYNTFDSYAVKFTRDAEMEFDDDITESLYEKVADGLRERQLGSPVRLNYDAELPGSMLKLLQRKLKLTAEDTLFPGGRYHNRRDLLKFPDFGLDHLTSPNLRQIPHAIDVGRENGKNTSSNPSSLFSRIRKNDVLLHFPYHSFSTFIDLLREASIDPLVRTIEITVYRFAEDSSVARALIAAVQNGKHVTAVIEPRARFDEGQNMHYANLFQESGVHVILGIPGLKVHAKLCLITRAEGGAERAYACVGTGNFNESTASLYTDHLLLTADRRIGDDVARAFRYFQSSYRPPRFHHLVAAPHTLRIFLHKAIYKEITNAHSGKPAEIFLKLNNLADPETTAMLYEASRAGVKVKLIIRSMFSVVPEVPGHSENIEAIGIVDGLLEHTRIFRFANGGSPTYHISSADFLPRNFDSRFEIVCPIFAKPLQKEFDKYLDLQWRDNVKARVLDRDLKNVYRKQKKKDDPLRAQAAIPDYLENAKKSKKG